jgi:ABC-type Na+ efflux pump permease subunit
VKFWVTSEACQKFGADRRSGALELLLSTPLTVREILRGQMLAQRRQFLAPVIVIVAIDVVFLFSGLRQVSVSGGANWMWLCLAGISSFAADVYTLAWVGLWLGLTARHANRATSATVARVLVLPWLACFGLWLSIALLELGRLIDNESYFFVGSWFVLGMLNDFIFCLWARTRLLGSLRAVATQRFSQSGSWFGWRQRRRPARTSEMPPAMAH